MFVEKHWTHAFETYHALKTNSTSLSNTFLEATACVTYVYASNPTNGLKHILINYYFLNMLIQMDASRPHKLNMWVRFGVESEFQVEHAQSCIYDESV